LFPAPIATASTLQEDRALVFQQERSLRANYGHFACPTQFFLRDVVVVQTMNLVCHRRLVAVAASGDATGGGDPTGVAPDCS
jgi:hypothetical protein